MRIIEAREIADTVARLCISANRVLPDDVREKILEFREKEPWPAARDVLDRIVENYQLAEAKQTPVCQDTGMACVFVDIGQEVHIEGDLNEAIDEGVRRGYREGFLRKSMATDPLERKNSGDNAPAMRYFDFIPGDKISVTVAPKGFGSENMSRIKMLRPSDGVEGVEDFVLSTVKEAGPNPCPPILVGVGIGGNFDKAALIAKKALLRPLNRHNGNSFYADLEVSLLNKINALGIGPQGLGGRTTALGVAIETLPTHIAGLPCAVNISCHADRRVQEIL
ncbi:MAG: fumarate hydratase [Treponema sp.]|jgi:fumarate hydratase subunit alpha|nr:fumarate hydratase [Treponema sp.]